MFGRKPIKTEDSGNSINPYLQKENVILEQYITEYPSNQNAIDIFKGEWSSELPLCELVAGQAKLFDDNRIIWLIKQLNSIENFNILELGPLEGGHSYMLEQAGAESIFSIEANTRAYLKCLIVKEIFDLKTTKFACGDFNKYLERANEKYDLVVASGVLYHMKDPVKLIADISGVTDRVFIWTHYYDDQVIKNRKDLTEKFNGKYQIEYNGFNCELYKQEYLSALGWAGFCGGMNDFSYWMKKEDIISCLKHFGFNDISTEFDDPKHQNGPSFALLATK